jgi:ribosomal protein L40E
MIVCPNCSHPNPEGATQCEACFTPLPIATSCPNCGAAVQTDATFCGQCGFNLKSSAELGGGIPIPKLVPDAPLLVVPEIVPDPLVALEPVAGVPETPPPTVNPPDPEPSPLSQKQAIRLSSKFRWRVCSMSRQEPRLIYLI